MIQVKYVTKRYGNTLANNDVNLEAGDGEITVLLGANGAGKSTLIKCICGLLRFEGSIIIDGYDNHSLEAKRQLGYIPELPAMYPMLTVEEHLQFIARAYRLKDWEEYGKELMTRFELTDKKEKLGQELSKGMQQKVSICCALLPRPKAVIFDEPFVGLDPHAIRELKQLIISLRDSRSSVIISTHMIETMEEAWDTTYIMKNGSIIESRKRKDLDSKSSLESIYFAITEGSDATGDNSKN
ncbi:ABC-type multidrug transport system, ATPase component [Anaerocolumna jejuensis DSM 15929]|uniref:ABC-type multidrug transport system, ATPase component n=1 Tax=Anaerocolumna jejuensis DSM 15929 TaxID=1121322 RepID=A0A1M6KQK2_9FIRM|nr:ABC transporter ATP-binding protein [Anaerocolumna jejuensis]SHJ61209.1 ABC-type multidrug transport system, ATPase component [Anaerocolumna jejuensis DSM 15929]